LAICQDDSSPHRPLICFGPVIQQFHAKRPFAAAPIMTSDFIVRPPTIRKVIQRQLEFKRISRQWALMMSLQSRSDPKSRIRSILWNCSIPVGLLLLIVVSPQTNPGLDRFIKAAISAPHPEMMWFQETIRTQHRWKWWSCHFEHQESRSFWNCFQNMRNSARMIPCGDSCRMIQWNKEIWSMKPMVRFCRSYGVFLLLDRTKRGSRNRNRSVCAHSSPSLFSWQKSLWFLDVWLFKWSHEASALSDYWRNGDRNYDLAERSPCSDAQSILGEWVIQLR